MSPGRKRCGKRRSIEAAVDQILRCRTEKGAELTAMSRIVGLVDHDDRQSGRLRFTHLLREEFARRLRVRLPVEVEQE
eukprot:3846952-Prymnesium_polylepis.1